MKTHDEIAEATQNFINKMGMARTVATPEKTSSSWQYEIARLRADISNWYKALEVDILWLAVWCVIIGYVLFVAFDVTSTFPISVKWGIASGSLFIFASALTILSVWRRQRTLKG